MPSQGSRALGVTEELEQQECACEKEEEDGLVGVRQARGACGRTAGVIQGSPSVLNIIS